MLRNVPTGRNHRNQERPAKDVHQKIIIEKYQFRITTPGNLQTSSYSDSFGKTHNIGKCNRPGITDIMLLHSASMEPTRHTSYSFNQKHILQFEVAAVDRNCSKIKEW